MKVEIGKRYVMRRGDVTGEIVRNQGLHYTESHPFLDPESGNSYRPDGGFLVSEADGKDECDLVAEWVEPVSESDRMDALLREVLEKSRERVMEEIKNGMPFDAFGAEPTTRARILDTAKKYVTQDRQATHGAPEDTFGRIAALWSAYLDIEIGAHEVCSMMALLKIARAQANPFNEDNWVDLAGYAACGGELAK